MTLEELIFILKMENPDKRIKVGFDSRYAYFGGTNDALVFKMAENVSVQQMLSVATDSVLRFIKDPANGEISIYGCASPETEVSLSKGVDRMPINKGTPLHLIIDKLLSDENNI